MWRRTYLLLLVIRVYFALSPSYLHPDENFQGPEVVAGQSVHAMAPIPPIPCFRPHPPSRDRDAPSGSASLRVDGGFQCFRPVLVAGAYKSLSAEHLALTL